MTILLQEGIRLLTSAATSFLLALAFAGCKVGPDYQRPSPLAQAPMPEAFSSASATNTPEWKPAEPSAHLPRGPWWGIFGEPYLDNLEQVADRQNQELAAALSRLKEARATVNISRADLLPQASLNPSYTRQRTSANDHKDTGVTGVAYTYNTFSMPLQAAWEVDLWGRVRRQVESAKARLTATADDLAALSLTIQAEIATDYFTLRALDAEYDLLSRTAETYRRSLELTMNRRKGGVATELDVAQAQTQLRATESDLPALRLQRVRLEHALATLCGQPATGFTIPLATNYTEKLPSVPIALPSELLERRPDVAAAEQRMAAANADIGVAQGAFYPRLLLNGLAGFQSISASSWFDWPSRFWAVGPTLELPLYTGGRNRAQLAFARATYDETVAGYRQTVLNAFQEVEDQIAAQQLLHEQLTSEQAALVAAQHTVEIANNRYKAGLVTYLEVATAQSAALNLERTVVQLRGDKLVASVALIRALGGGWEADSAKVAATQQ